MAKSPDHPALAAARERGPLPTPAPRSLEQVLRRRLRISGDRRLLARFAACFPR
ncbi:hypothetical protein VB738_01505 [Cyanobium gracile UHCC 0139]|uniref:Uncharacterized protein n=1 Tax=Cyanobium gracile UHCC 0139 TaxID=3110308 RepID=A0ABU5RQ74_9CYAN|nr:hypothetical protein [Cyanobium gracile]MEA5389926.1 hypothetical protein [Cyanobium gracile UHCC 0139]